MSTAIAPADKERIIKAALDGTPNPPARDLRVPLKAPRRHYHTSQTGLVLPVLQVPRRRRAPRGRRQHRQRRERRERIVRSVHSGVSAHIVFQRLIVSRVWGGRCRRHDMRGAHCAGQGRRTSPRSPAFLTPSSPLTVVPAPRARATARARSPRSR
jgi:hypothetical protein